MKKLILLVVAVVAFASAASAQEKWAVGGRVGTGFEAVGEYHFSDKNYVEARFGMDYSWGLNADFSALYMWNCLDFDWTPGQGSWYLDAGVGLRVGGQAHWARIGVQGVAKLGYTFQNLPLSITFDFSPSFGPAIGYGFGYKNTYKSAKLQYLWGGNGATFDSMAICSFGFSCVYRF